MDTYIRKEERILILLYFLTKDSSLLRSQSGSILQGRKSVLACGSSNERCLSLKAKILAGVSESSRGLVKAKTADHISRVSDSLGLRWSLRFCISNKLPGDVNAVGPQTTLELARFLMPPKLMFRYKKSVQVHLEKLVSEFKYNSLLTITHELYMGNIYN